MSTSDSTTLLPFGSMAGDVEGGAGDDLLVAVLNNPVGITCDCVVSNRIFIYTNGYITFDSNYESPNPAILEPNNNPQKMVAPFWSDIDLKTDSKIWYQLYNKFGTANVSNTLSEVKSIVVENFRDSSVAGSFEPNTALVVTWENVVQSPALNHALQNATFQLLLTSDGVTTYTAYLFKTMNFLPPKPAMLGYKCGNSPSSIFNHPGSLTNAIYDEVINSGDNAKNTKGLWVYKLDTCSSSAINYVERCQNWRITTAKTQQELVALAHSLLVACPCNIRQVKTDPRFIASSAEPGCYFKVHSPTGYSFTRKCCYSSSSAEGPLLTGVAGSGYVYLYNPLLYPSLSQSYDTVPYNWCCVEAGLCDVFFAQRTSDNCLNYKSPESGVSYGDPHINTIDGLKYTYNGLGEYTMLEVKNISSGSIIFELQSRTTLAQNETGSEIHATIFSAFAAREDNVTAQVEVNLEKNGIIVFCNGLDVTNEFYNDTSYECSQNNKLRLSRSQVNNHSVQILFPSEIALIVSFDVLMLDLNILIPKSLSNETENRGLLGNINGDPTDDLTLRNGSVMSKSSSEKDIYYTFGESWRLDSANSIFSYRAGESCAMFQNNSFVPLFFEDFKASLIEKANETCKGDSGCLYDYLATQSKAIAENSKNILETLEMRQLQAANTAPEIKGALLVNATIGQSLTLVVEASDSDGNLITVVGPDSNSTGKGTANISYTYLPTTADQQISFWAVDNTGSASNTLTVIIVKCSGCSSNGTCDFDHPKPTLEPNQFTAPCICDIGYEGVDCSVDVDGCHDNPCQPPHICTDNSPTEHNNTGVAFQCSDCPAGYKYGNERKCVDVDECTNGSQCSDHQICTNVLGSFSCSCEPGYRTDVNQNQACLDVNECYEQTSGCQQLCNNTDGGYICYCREGYSLNSDNRTCLADTVNPTCLAYNCSHSCLLESGSPKCYCDEGYTLAQDGKNCNDINECTEETSKKCPQICTNTIGGFSCSCHPGYQLMPDLKSCTACDAVHWGVNCNQSCDCTQNALSCDPKFGCRCKEGWTGTHCETNINECQDGGPCGALENCVDTPGSYVCQCKGGYQRNDTSGNCENIDECSESLYNCTETEVCIDTPGSYRCECKSGYQRDATGQCQDVNECELQTDQCTHHCINTEGSYNCKCNIGYTLQDDRRTCVMSSNPCEGATITCDNSVGGCTTNSSRSPYCFCNQGYQFNQTSRKCTDIDECAESIDSCSEVCNNTVGGFFCSCSMGSDLLADRKTCQSCNKTDRWGNTCENQCSCGPGALFCDSLIGCVCAAGWTGSDCSTDINECYNVSTNNCGPNSNCVNREPSYICQCESGYTKVSNSQTECTDIDECQTNQHDCSQRCQNIIGSFICACSDGFQLENDNKTCKNVDECKLQSDDCQQICVDTTGSYHCQCHPGFNLADDLHTCIKDPNYDPCNAAGLPNECSYACRITDGSPECYCDSNSRLNSTDNKTCIALDNKIMINMTTDYPFNNDLLHPPSTTYKNTKKDFEDSLMNIFRRIPGLENVVPVITNFRTGTIQAGDTTVEFYLVLDQDKTSSDITNVSSALVNLRKTQITVSGARYNLLQEPTIGPSQEPAVCNLCPDSCYYFNETDYQCRPSFDEDKTLTVQLSLEKAFEPHFNDSRTPKFKQYSDQISSSLRRILSSPNLKDIFIQEFRELSGSKTEITALVSMNTSVTEANTRTVALELYENVDNKNCLTVETSCIKLRNQTYIGNNTSLVAVICYTCSQQQICVFETNKYHCVEAPSTTVTTPAQTDEPSNTDLIFGLGLGVPLALILFLLILILMCLLCRRNKRRRSYTDSEFSSVDPYHIREAFGSVSSKISGHKPIYGGGLGVGMFGASPYVQQPRDIIDSQRHQEPFEEEPYNYGNQFYREEVDTFTDNSHFDARRDDLPPSSNFSWDFLFNVMDPREEFRIDRPTFNQTPTAPYQDEFGSEA
ncbi:uncharacterized protein LOC133196904 [Saccostrea echinata]|uniref:uncharacterized protein LOC133196904 n=1 Tax=Saccostrea echinata TaxID=191078 RepID=UPI002A7FACCC|nr:uncharacterized protein LOC133196904 [Saccostrea echinata]